MAFLNIAVPTRLFYRIILIFSNTYMFIAIRALVKIRSTYSEYTISKKPVRSVCVDKRTPTISGLALTGLILQLN